MAAITVSLDGVAYKLRFQHGEVDWIPRKRKPPIGPGKYKCTRVWLQTNVSDAHVWAARSYCGPTDVFSRPEGRKKALEKLVEDMPRHWRRAIWNAYWRGTGREGFINGKG